MEQKIENNILENDLKKALKKVEELTKQNALLESENKSIKKEKETYKKINETLTNLKNISEGRNELLINEVETLKSQKSLLENKLKDNSYSEKIKFDELFNKYEDLECKYFKLQVEQNKILKKLEKEIQIVKVYNHNKYYSPSEKAFNEEQIEDEKSPINEVEKNLESNAKKKVGRKKGSKNFANIDFEKLVSKTVTLDESEKLLANGWKIAKIGEDVSYLLKVNKVLEVIKVVTPKYKRIDIKENKIYQAIKNNTFPHSVCTPSLAADIIEAKYDLGVPLSRYSKYLNSINIPLSEMDLTNFVIRSDAILNDLYLEIKKNFINPNVNVIHADETPLQVLDYKNIDGRKNGYIFAYVSSFYNHPIYLYDFNKTRETKKTNELLKDFKGYLVCDGYPGYKKLNNDNIKLQYCFAHIRRKFYDIAKVLSPKLREISAAYKMVKKIDRLFVEESKINPEVTPPSKIHEIRNSPQYLKILNDVYDYLHTINAEEGTPLDAAVKYFLKLEEGSKTFLNDGHIPITNNLCERIIKPFVINRKGFLFAKTENGAEITARLFTIFQTAKVNGLAPSKYIEYALDNIGKIPIEDLLPWSNKLPSEIHLIVKQ